jgi:adenylate cyclase, class 2
MMMIEIEVRSPLWPAVADKLAPLLQTMQVREEKTSQDIYYDTRGFDLLQHPRHVFVRLREGRLLQFKFDEDAHLQTACIEREFLLTDEVPEKAHALFQMFLPTWQPVLTWERAIADNHFVELARINKTRRVYVDGPLIVSIDHVEGLGRFVEIERNCEEGADTQAAREHVHRILENIGGVPLKAGYFEMWLCRYNQQAYQFVPPRFRVEDVIMTFS